MSRFMKRGNELVSNHSTPNRDSLTIMLTLYSHRTVITVENPSQLSRVENVAFLSAIKSKAFADL